MSKSSLCLEGVTAPYLELLVIPRASGVWLLVLGAALESLVGMEV